jgi:MFS family permease
MRGVFMFPIIILLAIMGLVGTDLFVPSLPDIASVFHESQNHAQLIISLFLAGFAASQLFYGPISDYTGRKPPILFGTLIFIIATIICAEATHFDWLCFGRMIQGIGAGAVYATLQIAISMLGNLILNIMTHQNQALLGVMYFLISIVSLALSQPKKIEITPLIAARCQTEKPATTKLPLA